MVNNMSYGISGNKHRGAHLELSKVNKVIKERKPRIIVHEHENEQSTYFPRSDSTAVMTGDSVANFNPDKDERPPTTTGGKNA
jgi:hypothetical protein